VPEVDVLVAAVRRRGAKEGLYGAKITGGGAGGTVAVFGRLAALKKHVPAIAREHVRRFGVLPETYWARRPGRSSSARGATSRAREGGNGKRRDGGEKAVIPVAGLGTRLFPASQAVKKELMPVVGPDGVARAMIHYHVAELVAAGIEDICIVAQPGDEEAIRAYFLRGARARFVAAAGENAGAGRRGAADAGVQLAVAFAVQREQEGYGHAVYQAAPSPAASRCCCAWATTCSAARRFRPIANWRKWPGAAAGARFPRSTASGRRSSKATAPSPARGGRIFRG
jgi:hypothetical protein